MSNVFCIRTRQEVDPELESALEDARDQFMDEFVRDEDLERRSNLEYTGYWGHVLKRAFAWLPTKTEDAGWIWFQRYYRFDTNTGYDKHGWNWECQGKTVAPMRMMAIKMGFYACQDTLELIEWRRKRGLTA